MRQRRWFLSLLVLQLGCLGAPSSGCGGSPPASDADARVAGRGVDGTSAPSSVCADALGCDDGLPCTVDRCLGGRCRHDVLEGFCAIGGRCVEAGSLSPTDPCVHCDPRRDVRRFSRYVCTTTAAGSGAAGLEDGRVLEARFALPTDVAVGPKGEIYVADAFNHVIRVVHGGHVETFAGSGEPGFADGSAALARFKRPYAVAVDPRGLVYVADTENHRVRVIEAGQVSTLAGSGISGTLDGPGILARFKQPRGLAVDATGVVFVADMANHRIRQIRRGVVSTMAGSEAGFRDGVAQAALFNSPVDVAVDIEGRLYIADMANQRVRLLAAGVVSTFAGGSAAGTSDGHVGEARFHWPQGVAVVAGDVFVSDTFSHRLRRIHGGRVTTLAGSDAGYGDSPSPPRFNYPWGVAVSGGVLYVADRNNERIRRVYY